MNKKGVPEVGKYEDGSVGARMRMLCRGGCLPARANACMRWKYEGNEECGCGSRETMEWNMFC